MFSNPYLSRTAGTTHNPFLQPHPSVSQPMPRESDDAVPSSQPQEASAEHPQPSYNTTLHQTRPTSPPISSPLSSLPPSSSSSTSFPWSDLRLWLGLPPRRSLSELTDSSAWKPERARFDVRWPADGGELRNEWYESLYQDLFANVGVFASGHFDYGDLPGLKEIKMPTMQGLTGHNIRSGTGGVDEGRKGHVWLEGRFEEQFLWFVEQVAIQDRNVGGWDVVLLRGWMRVYLVAGIIGKVLETSVWDDLLFGADKCQKTMLEAQDECTLHFDAYHRTHLRSMCVRTLLVGDLLTPEFWPRVDEVALQLTTLLLPLINLMDKHFPASRAKPLRSIYQELHGIVAQAGFLALGVRWSRNIFRFSAPHPGDIWENDQVAVDKISFEISEAVNNRADRIAESEWQERRRLQQREREEREAHGPSLRDRAGAMVDWSRDKLKSVRRRLKREPIEEKPDEKDEWHAPSRITKVQIALWPMLQRFESSGRTDPETGFADGETETNIFYSRVVHFYGRTDGQGEDSDDYPTLREWVVMNKRDRLKFLLPLLRWSALAAGVWGLSSLVGLYVPLVGEVVKIVTTGLALVAATIVREAILIVLEMVITAVAAVIGVAKIALFIEYAIRTSLVNLTTFLVQTPWDILREARGLSWSSPGLGVVPDWREGLRSIPAVAFPDLGWGSLRELSRALVGDIVWKTVTVQVPVGHAWAGRS